jgi:hypothetical protein
MCASDLFDANAANGAQFVHPQRSYVPVDHQSAKGHLMRGLHLMDRVLPERSHLESDTRNACAVARHQSRSYPDMREDDASLPRPDAALCWRQD